MKKLFAGTQHTKFIAAASAFIWTIAIATSARAVQLHAARITQVTNDVKVLLEKAPPRPVALSDVIRHGTAVRTGTQSRTEVTFDDLTITRLVANTTFSFKEGTREMNLIDGAILFQVPKGSGGATIRTAAVTAVITGTTGIGEFHPATSSNPHLFSKWLCLEGTFHLYLPNGQSVELGPGKMVTTDGNNFSTVLTFDIAKLVSTSLFFTGFDRPLPSLDLIVLEEQKQLASMLLTTPTPNPLDPMRIYDLIDLNKNSNPAFRTPTPTPSKFGTPKVITSPVPYLITSGTAITTDPSITTNGVTDFGKIYRGPVDDGAFSLWAFGSTSAVDTALDFDTHFNNAGHFPAAAFKFTSLVLAGNPTIDLTNGGVTNLALISVGDITSGLPGGTLTFTGLDALLLASQDGSINLGSEITFQGIPTLFFYARGTNGDLTLASPIIGTTDLFLYAGRNITFNAGTDLILGGGGVMNGNVTLDLSAANISSGGDLVTDISANQGGHILGNAFNHVSAAGNLTAQGALDFEIQNAGFLLNNGGTIDMDATINVSATNISATTDYFQALIWNAGGGHIGGNAVLDISASNGLTTGGDAFFSILNSPNGEGTFAGTIGGNATIQVNIGSMSVGGSVGGFLDAVIDNTSGHIGGDAVINFDVSSSEFPGDIDTQGDAIFQIFNSGGTIAGNVEINLSAANIGANSLLVQIDNSNVGVIDGHAAINMNVSGNTSITTEATVQILGNDPSGSAAINFNGGSYTVGSPGSGGMFLSSIDGNGTITFYNASVHADVIKAGVFGINGVLNIGGGILSADSELKLYAPGSNGKLNFVSNVTLGGNSMMKILAANSITICDNVVVTIGGSNPAQVYTNNANYTGFGGNGMTTGTFGGKGANIPQPLASATPFGPTPPSRAVVRRGVDIINAPRTSPPVPPAINVNNTAELLALLDGAAVGRDGKITISGSTTKSNLRDLSRINMNGLPRGVRAMLIHEMRDRSTTQTGGRRTL